VKLGCLGCLTLIVVVLVIIVGSAGFFLLSSNIFETPQVTPATFTRSDGHVAQQKLHEVLLRQSGRSTRRDPIVLTDREANAFLANHLAESASLPFDPLVVRFDKGEIEVQGRTATRNLLRSPIFRYLIPYLPAKNLDQPIWVSVRGRVLVEPTPPGSSRTYGKIEFTELSLGKQPVGPWLLHLLLGQSTTSLRRWPIPGVVTAVEIQEARAIIRTN
jgi:hypothetical protein